MELSELIRLNLIVRQTFKGGQGSGNFGHAGRPGEVGGSATNNIVSGSQRDKNLKKWFGNSKVVDENGNPKIVYHATKSDFDIYSVDKIGSETDEGYYGKGFYFTDNPEHANQYAGDITHEFAENSNIQPVYLKIERPLEIYKNGKSNKLPDDIMEILPEYIKSTETGLNIPKREIYSSTELAQTITPNLFANYLRKAGYDGAYLEYGIPGHYYREYIVFSPNQIKSTFNRGTFSNSSSILKEIKP